MCIGTGEGEYRRGSVRATRTMGSGMHSCIVSKVKPQTPGTTTERFHTHRRRPSRLRSCNAFEIGFIYTFETGSTIGFY